MNARLRLILATRLQNAKTPRAHTGVSVQKDIQTMVVNVLVSGILICI